MSSATIFLLSALKVNFRNYIDIKLFHNTDILNAQILAIQVQLGYDILPHDSYTLTLWYFSAEALGRNIWW